MSTVHEYQHDCDVLIIGAGLAGSALARHLLLELPDLKIIVVEKKQVFDYSLGESTVEAFDIYMHKALRLAPYLEKWFGEKHGLRYFYDSEEKNLGILEMSEFGRDRRHLVRASQLDRQQIDTELVEMNRASGIEVLMGTRVLGRAGEPAGAHIRIDPKNGHTVDTTAGRIRCRWLVDAGGRTAPLSQAMGVYVKDERHPIAAYWGRWEGCNVIDQLGDDAWRRQVQYTQRYQSTCHFMYRGYWIWVIPLRQDIVSIGVSMHPGMLPMKFHNGEELEQFFRSHRALGEIMGKSPKRLDFMALPHCAQYAKERFSEDRWYVAGWASGVVDALNSNTSRMWPEINTFIVELIKSDRGGDKKRLRSQLKHFNIRAQQVYEGVLEAYRHYDFWGSFDVHMPYGSTVIASFWNSIIPDYYNDFDVIKRVADEHGTDCACVVDNPHGFARGTVGVYARVARELLDVVDRKGLYFASNRGKFQNQLHCELRPGIWDKTYKPRDLAAEREQDLETYAWLFRSYVVRLADIEGRRFNEKAFDEVFERRLDSEQTLASVLGRCSSPR